MASHPSSTSAPVDAGPTASSGEAEQLVAFARAVVNPLRLRILLVAAAHEEITPRAVATDLQVGLGRLSYHIRYLADLGALELQRTVPIRGAVQHVYALSPAARAFMDAARRGGLITPDDR
jgi:DNA-binding transcriptional ArsR family regulator